MYKFYTYVIHSISNKTKIVLIDHHCHRVERHNGLIISNKHYTLNLFIKMCFIT